MPKEYKINIIIAALEAAFNSFNGYGETIELAEQMRFALSMAIDEKRKADTSVITIDDIKNMLNIIDNKPYSPEGTIAGQWCIDHANAICRLCLSQSEQLKTK